MCQNQDHPQLTVQNLTFVDGNSTGETIDGGGGGAIFVRGGRFKIVESPLLQQRLRDRRARTSAVRRCACATSTKICPVYVVHSTFGGADGLRQRVLERRRPEQHRRLVHGHQQPFSHNDAIGNGANPARSGTPGGGSGGAIYNDGNTFTLTLCGTHIDGQSRQRGRRRDLLREQRPHRATSSSRTRSLRRNPSDGFETQGYPGIFFLGMGDPMVSGSTIE